MKTKYIIIAAGMFLLAIVTSCGKEKNKEVMTLTTSAPTVEFRLSGSGEVTIDWGDGSEKETIIMVSVSFGPFKRDYTSSYARSIRIYGENITQLNCRENQLTNLDVSKNTALTFLECSNNRLTSLNVSKNTKLTYLNCDGNQIWSLGVKNTKLIHLHCNSNQLTSLDISKNTALIGLRCSYNQLTILDVSKNTALTGLNCSNNPLTSLDMSKNTALTNLDCSNNQLSKEALDDLFGTLHDTTFEGKWVYFRYNPGTNTCNPSIATAKGWKINP